MGECIEREALITIFKKMGLGEHGLVERLFADGVYAVIAAFPAADVAPIEALERLRDELCAQDLITMEGLRKLNTLIWKYTTVHDGGADHEAG